jgi:glycogen debranching enzyme
MSALSGILPLVLLLVHIATAGDLRSGPITVGELGISVDRGRSRIIAYTNKEAGVFATETNGKHRTAWQGWRVMSNEILEGVRIELGGGRMMLDPSAAHAVAYPDRLVRVYPDGTRETITMLDSVNVLLEELACPATSRLVVRPLFSAPGGYRVDFRQHALLLAAQRHPVRSASEDYPVWIGLAFGSAHTSESAVLEPDTNENAYSPAGLSGTLSDSVSVLIIAAGDTEEETLLLLKRVALSRRRMVQERRARMERLLNSSFLRTDDRPFDKALQWAKISLDALIMHQRGTGMFAGLPWFDNYWGRDTYISLPGAALVTGQFEEARRILSSFAVWQDTAAGSPSFGRIPNLVTTGSLSYNTADGTPRFILALDEYVQTSGDTAILRQLYPVVKRSIEGTFRYHTDSLMFLTHGDAETWMDAAGPDGPWSPRGNRANDIQWLWWRQLGAGARWALSMGDTSSRRRWQTAAEALRENFNKYFLDARGGLIYDHLKPDGMPDRKLRPNQLFALPMVGEDSVAVRVFQTVTASLVYPYGIASLWQGDSAFHPFHHYAPYYVQDAAYHNGIVWTWLAGAWIDRAVSYGLSDLAFRLTDSMAALILTRGAVGTLPEVMDAWPRPRENEPSLSGTYSQAWSLAEFIRTWYQAYLGIRVDALSRRVSFRPALPGAVAMVDVVIPAGSSRIEARYHRQGERDTLVLSSIRGGENITLRVELADPEKEGSVLSCQVELLPGGKASLLRQGGTLSSLALTRAHFQALGAVGKASQPESLKNLHFAVPVIRPGIEALRGPAHRLLSHAEIKQENPAARILFETTDPEGDDTGEGRYTYPTTSSLLAGSLDITRFQVAADERTAYFTLIFRNLSDPGWHPEYGFQLTFAAIAIDDGAPRESCQTRVGVNSNYDFHNGFAYRRIIFVGGGVRIDDARGRVLAEYIPSEGDEAHPLGDVRAKRVAFALPAEILGGKPSKSWRYAVLIGCQDDHGGAGIGEFRGVGERAEEWKGGGKADPAASNVYDSILPP